MTSTYRNYRLPRLFTFIVLTAVIMLSAVNARAVELEGQISKVAGDTIVITLNSQFLPRQGDSVNVTTDHPSLGTMNVGTWRVTNVTNSAVVAAKLNATGVPQAGMRVVISSPDPVSKSALVKPKPVAKPAPVTPPPPVQKQCRLATLKTKSKNCPQGSVYAGPQKPEEHGGICLSAGPCRIYSWRTKYTECGPYAVYTGPEKSEEHGGSCVLLDEPGMGLRSMLTRNKSCGLGVYVGPNKVQEHSGYCLEIIQTQSRR
ncbi:MAG: hypothetical protein HKN70_08895 [Gammaproteobacteria bacterium]|nr:hypothetical protein [Gammaproteobacteria bacterium]